MRCCVDLVKFFLFMFNFLCFLGFCALFGGTVYVLLYGADTFIGRDIQPSLDKADPENATYFLFVIISLIVTGFLASFTCLGCCGAATKSGCMLGSFIVILFVFFGGSVGALIFLHHQFGWKAVDEVLVRELGGSLPTYREENILTYRFWNWLQPTFSCCGVSSPESYSAWEGVAGLPANWKVPDVCCDQETEEKDCMYEPNHSNTFSDGCADKILLYAQILFYGIPSIMFVSLVFAFVVSASVSSAERRRKEARGRGDRERDGDTTYNSRYSEGAEEDFSHHHAAYPATPMYSDNPPYNPGYSDPSDYYGGYSGPETHAQMGGSISGYPVGTVPPPHSHVPLLHQAPPSYNEVVSRQRK